MLPDNLKQLRKAAGLTQYDLGDKLGVSQQTIGQWEKGTRKPNVEMLKKIASFFNVSTDFLMGSEKPLDVQICENIKFYREKLGVSQSSLADYLGVTVERIEDLENGRSSPTVNELEKISSGLWTSLEDILSMKHLFGDDYIRYKFLEETLNKFGYTCLKAHQGEKSSYIISFEDSIYEVSSEQFKNFIESIDSYISFSANQLLKKTTRIK